MNTSPNVGPNTGALVVQGGASIGNRVTIGDNIPPYLNIGTAWIAGTSTKLDNGGWQSCCWSQDLSMFVAVAASGTARLATSSDGVAWALRRTVDDTVAWYDVCWSPEKALFVAVGASKAMYSSNGINWTASPTTLASTFAAIVWAPEKGIFVAVAQSGTGGCSMTSSDGISWSVASIGSDDTVVWNSVCWSPQLMLFVAVASSGTGRVMTSPDGTNSTSRTAASEV